MYEIFTDKARKILHASKRAAARYGKEEIGSLHILLGLLDFPDGVAIGMLNKLGIYHAYIDKEVRAIDPKGKSYQVLDKIPFDREGVDILAAAKDLSRHSYVDTEHVMLGLLSKDNAATKLLKNLGFQVEKCYAVLLDSIRRGYVKSVFEEWCMKNSVVENRSSIALFRLKLMFDNGYYLRPLNQDEHVTVTNMQTAEVVTTKYCLCNDSSHRHFFIGPLSDVLRKVEKLIKEGLGGDEDGQDKSLDECKE